MKEKIIYDIGKFIPFISTISTNKANSSLIEDISFNSIYVDGIKLPLYYIKSFTTSIQDTDNKIKQITLEILYYAIYHIIEDINTIEILLDEIIIKKSIREIYLNNKNIFYNNSIILYISDIYEMDITSKDFLFYLSLMGIKYVIAIPDEYLKGYKMLFVPKNSINLFIFTRNETDIVEKVAYSTTLPKFMKIKKI